MSIADKSANCGGQSTDSVHFGDFGEELVIAISAFIFMSGGMGMNILYLYS